MRPPGTPAPNVDDALTLLKAQVQVTAEDRAAAERLALVLAAYRTIRSYEDLSGLAALAALVVRRQLLDELSGGELERWLIDAARDGGVTWQQLAEPLGVKSRTGAERRLMRLSAFRPADLPLDEAIEQERDVRAYQREEARWTAEHHDELVELAKQLTAVARAQGLRDGTVSALGFVVAGEFSHYPWQLDNAGKAVAATHPDLAQRIAELGAEYWAIKSNVLEDRQAARRQREQETEADAPAVRRAPKARASGKVKGRKVVDVQADVLT